MPDLLFFKADALFFDLFQIIYVVFFFQIAKQMHAFLHSYIKLDPSP